MRRSRVLFTLAALSALLCCTNVLAATPSLQSTLQQRLDTVYGPLWKTGDAARFVDEFLTPDAVMTASDGPAVWAGRESCIGAIRELMKATQTVRARAVHTAPLGTDAAYEFVVFDLTGKDEHGKVTHTTAKSLYVWRHTAAGWRVAADHFSFTGMDMPH